MTRHDDVLAGRRNLVRLVLVLALAAGVAALLSGCSVMRCDCTEDQKRVRERL